MHMQKLPEKKIYFLTARRLDEFFKFKKQFNVPTEESMKGDIIADVLNLDKKITTSEKGIILIRELHPWDVQRVKYDPTSGTYEPFNLWRGIEQNYSVVDTLVGTTYTGELRNLPKNVPENYSELAHLFDKDENKDLATLTLNVVLGDLIDPRTPETEIIVAGIDEYRKREDPKKNKVDLILREITSYCAPRQVRHVIEP